MRWRRSPQGPAATDRAVAEVWQLLGSLGAIALLIVLVRAGRLGTSPSFGSEADVREAAVSVLDDFDAAEIAIDERGTAALLADRTGRVLLLRAHGAHVAGRLLAAPACATLAGDDLIVDPADPRFGRVRLAVAEPQRWKLLIDQL